MTRGTFIFIDEDHIWSSVEFNGDMYPKGRGKDALVTLHRVKDEKDFWYEIMHFDERHFHYAEEHDWRMVDKRPLDDVDFNHNTYFEEYSSDYLYIKTTIPITITDRKGEEIELEPDEVYTFYFGELELTY